MKAGIRLAGAWGVLAVSLCFSMTVLSQNSPSQSTRSDESTDSVSAELMPLASDSLILDITRSQGSYVAVGERGHVLISKDGVTWAQAAEVPTRSTLTSVFSLGDRLWAGGHDAVIISSEDGGNHWTLQSFDPQREQAVMDVFFTDSKNGMAIGSYGLYLRSRDGGQNWEDASVDADNEFHLNSMVSLGDDRLMIAGEAGYSYRSEDGGDSWEALLLPYEGSMWGAINAADDCVLFYGLRGHVQESCDFGDTWEELDTGTLASISGAAVNEGFLLLAANSGTLLTRNANGRFLVHHHDSGVDFSAALPMADGGFMLVGEDGVHHYSVTGVQDD